MSLEKAASFLADLTMSVAKTAVVNTLAEIVDLRLKSEYNSSGSDFLASFLYKIILMILCLCLFDWWWWCFLFVCLFVCFGFFSGGEGCRKSFFSSVSYVSVSG